MLFKKKRFFPLLALILSTALAMSVPVKAVATEVENFSNFAFASFFTADWTQTNTSGNSSVSVSGSTISLSATGSGSGCDVKANETTVTLTALKDVSITCTLDGANLSPPGEVTNNSDGSKTFVVGAGSTVSFSVSGANESTTGNGSVTFTKVEETKSLVPTDCASFSYNNKFYSYLDKALEAVGSGSGTITVVKDGKLYHSSIETDADYASKTFTFEIPGGVTLLVPFNSANTLIGSDPSSNLVDAYEDPSSPRSEYRKLIMPAGTKLSVASGGAICISSRIANQFVGQLGSYGAIYMNANSNITIQSGANLYAWGYIFYGDSTGGTVNIQNGGTVYEPISIMDYPGSSSLANTLKSNSVFPMRAYTVRNVEVPMTLQSSAKEYVSYCLWGNRVGTHPGKALMFSNAVDGSYTPVFQLASGTTITKSFKNKTQYITVNGDIVLNPLKVIIDAKMFGGEVTFSSSETPGFILPSGFDVTLAGGTMTLNDNVVMVEGSKLTIAHGAVADTNGKNLYLTDDADDVGAVQSTNGCSITVQNVHGDYYTRVAKDAVLDVNGTLKAGSTFYTSANKAEITSSKGTGRVELTGAPAETTIKVKDASSSYQNIKYTNAQLKNADGSYLNTSANNYSYDLNAGKWRCETHTGVETDHSCDVCGYVTECRDTDDHNCDICGKESITECIDTDSNAMCDVCGKNLCAHEGTIEPVEASAPTCTEDGVKAHHKCSTCGAQFADAEGTTPVTAEELAEPAAGHTMTPTEAKDPTCTEAGNIAYWTCDICGKVYSDEKGEAEAQENALVLQPTGHGWEHEGGVFTTTTTATCTEPGIKTDTCSCGEIRTEDVAALGHDEVSHEAQAQTCTEGGWDAYVTCSRCDYTTKVEKDALGHNEVAHNAQAPTCSEKGWDAYVTCSRCDYTTKVEKNALGHTPGAEATCTTAQTCTVCNAELVAAKGHTEVVDAAVDATCTAPGKTEGKHCSVCNTVIVAQNTVNALGHTAGDAATCTTAQTCTVCGAELAPATGHAWDNDCDPDCNNNCGETREITHSYTEKITTPATCEAEGVKTFTCGTCGDSYTEAIPALGHNMVAGQTFAPTCTADGYTVYTCANKCGKTENRETVTAAGHNYTAVETAPTFEADGYTTYTCHCGDSYVETHKGTKLTAVAKIGDNKYQTLDAAIEAAQDGETITLLAEAKQVVELPRNVTLDLNGYTLTGKFVGKLAVNGGTYITPEGYTMLGKDAVYYKTEDAVLTMSEYLEGKNYGDITVHSGTLEQVPEVWWTGVGQTLIIETGATYVISKGQTLNVNGSTIYLKGAATLGGKIVLYSTDAKVVADEGLNNIITKAGDKVWYTKGAYIVHSHTEEIDVAVAPTCTETGKTEGKHCSICGEVTVAQETVAALGHTEVTDAAVAPTCTEAGLAEGKHCSVCNEVLVAQQLVDALGHTEVTDAAVAPTCTEAGKTEGKHCSVCKEVLVAQETVAAKGHTEETIPGKDATCTEPGLTEGKKCSVCGVTTVAQEEIPALGHKEETIPGKDATCTETGLTDGVKCSVCGETITAQTEIPALDHTYANPVVTFAEDGRTYTVTVTCSQCSEDVVGHTETSSELKCSLDSYHDAGCQYKAEFTYRASGMFCNVDYNTTKTVTREQGNHDLEYKAAAEPRCTEDGMIEHWNCKVCGKKFAENQGWGIPALENVTIPATGHQNTTILDAVPATCAATGLTEGKKCLDCDTVIMQQQTIDKLEHSYNDGIVTTEPGCETTGVKTYTCTGCSATKTDTIPAKQHSYNTGVVTTAPTCTTAGVKTFTCQNDASHTYTEEVAALGHDMVAVDGKAATCTEAGYSAYTDCSRCDHIEGKNVLAATGHVNTTSSTVQNDNGTHTTTVTCKCGHVVSDETVTCTDAGNGSCACGRVMNAQVNVDNKTKTEGIWTITGTTMNVKHNLACVVLVEETDGTYTRLTATANANGGYDFDVSKVGSKTVVIAVKGDSNFDGIIDITDVLGSVYSFTSDGTDGKRYDELQTNVADTNNDSTIDISDILALVYAITGTALVW